jgi:hypothetical protein
MIENVQQRASKCITYAHTSDYKSRQQTLELLPIMYWYKLEDLLFFIKYLQGHFDNLNI